MPGKLPAKPPLGSLPLEAAYLAGPQSALHRRTLPRNPARASLRAPVGRAGQARARHALPAPALGIPPPSSARELCVLWRQLVTIAFGQLLKS